MSNNLKPLTGNSPSKPGGFDLHVHSLVSDGSLTPGQLVEEAAKIGLTGLALTDHDTIDGVEEFLKAGENHALTTIGGVEISLEHPGTMHVLGYNVTGKSEIPAVMSRLKSFRMDRNKQMHEKLEKMGYSLSWEELLAKSGGGQIGRPHFADMLLEAGYFKTWDEVFDQLLGKGRPGYVNKQRMAPKEGLAVIHDAGWASVLAHPASLELPSEQWPDVLKSLKNKGLVGLEVCHPSLNKDESDFFMNLAERFDLIPTVGSDFHGDRKPDIKLNWVLEKGLLFGQESFEKLKSNAN